MNDAKDADVEDTRARRKLDEILVSRQVILVTGKGGVGKSVVSAALAVRAKSLGLKPLLFECDAPPRLSLLPKGRPATDEVEEIAPGILGINQKSDDAIRDYAISTLPSKAVAEMLFENRIAKLFLKASPSVSEMALVGRIAILADKHGADGPIIVDLHATGHALSLLRAPGGIMKVLRSGILFERAKKIEELLADPVRTAFVTVALPEELPVSELLELHEKLKEIGAPEGPVVLNGMFREPAPDVSDAVVAHLDKGPLLAKNAARDLSALRAWARRSEREQARLATALHASRGAPDMITIPFFIDDGDASGMVQNIAEHLARPATSTSKGAA